MMRISALGKHLAMVMVGFFVALSMLNTPMTVDSTMTTIMTPKVNYQLPIAVSKAKASFLKSVNDIDLTCMATNIYYEAGGQSYAGKLAVGMVVLNRIHNPMYPKTVCGVVYDANELGCQFSWTCSGESKQINEESYGWKASVAAAYAILSRDKSSLVDLTDGALYFHNNEVNPDWSSKKKKTAKIDDHIFYK